MALSNSGIENGTMASSIFDTNNAKEDFQLRPTIEGKIPSIRSIKLLLDMAHRSSSASCCRGSPHHDEETLRLIFDRALLVSMDEQDDDITSATMLYNEALAHHIRGLLLDQCNKSEHFEKALQRYQTALVLVLTRGSSSSARTLCHSVDLLILALLNNSVHIQAMFFHREGVAESLDYMRCILDAIAASWYRHQNHHEDHHDYIFFDTTSLFCSEHSLDVSPAA